MHVIRAKVTNVNLNDTRRPSNQGWKFSDAARVRHLHLNCAVQLHVEVKLGGSNTPSISAGGLASGS
jgi:hypothetical protein